MADLGPEEKNPVTQVVREPSEEPLPLSTALLSNLALSLLMWNITLRLVGFLLAA